MATRRREHLYAVNNRRKHESALSVHHQQNNPDFAPMFDWAIWGRGGDDRRKCLEQVILRDVDPTLNRNAGDRVGLP